MILTAAGIDPHVHLVSPQQAYHALSGGVTTLIGGGIGPTDGTNGTTITSGIWNMEMMLKANEGLPVNVCMLGKGNSSGHQSLVEQIKAGAAGLKVHEDWGATPATIRESLRVADEMDVQVAIHTDTLNEAGYVEDTIAAFEGRTIHTYHSEGAGGGHAPDILRVTGEDNVLPASTNPTLPYGINTQAELFDMIMVCHNLNPKVPSDVSFAESRVRAETIGAENVLQDMGVISMFSSDSQAMGRVGENWLRAIQTADCMKRSRGKLPEDSPTHDNFRVFALRREGHDQSSVDVRSFACGRVDRCREDGGSCSLGARILRREAEDDHQERVDQLARHGRSECVAPDTTTGDLPADVRWIRQGVAAEFGLVRLASGARRRHQGSTRSRTSGCRRRGHEDGHQA